MTVTEWMGACPGVDWSFNCSLKSQQLSLNYYLNIFRLRVSKRMKWLKTMNDGCIYCV